jgi:8-oxo-dGTP diphosphatase
MTIVTAAIIIKNHKILIARRNAGSLAGFWEFPGGKLEEGETVQECLARELFEEFAVNATIGEPFGISEYKYDHGTIKLVAIYAQIEETKITSNAHDKVEWVSPKDLLTYKLAPADVAIAEKFTC